MKKLLAYGLFAIVILGGATLYSAKSSDRQHPDDIIARVGNQIITLSQIDTMINSSSMVGLDIPAVGTAERNKARITTLDKVVSANLLFLDARKQGKNREPLYLNDVDRFSKSILAGLYRGKILVGEIQVTEAEIQNYYRRTIKKETDLTEDLKLAIAATIRKEKHKARIAGLRGRLRQGATITVDEKELDPEKDRKRKDSAIVARLDRTPITWGRVKAWFQSGAQQSLNERLTILNRFIDEQLMAQKALKAGLDTDPVYLARIEEYKKVRLVNIHRGALLKQFAPDDKVLQRYYKKNREKIVHPESRKIQMVVVKTEKEAENLKKKIEAGKITIHQAAQDYSIDPNAGKTLGEMGWVAKGSGFPELDRLAFSLKKEALGGPVQSPAGWHLVKVLDIRAPLYASFDEQNARNRTHRLYMHEKLNAYVVHLRKNKFPVEVYEDVMSR